jgi:hypothetical protein
MRTRYTLLIGLCLLAVSLLVIYLIDGNLNALSDRDFWLKRGGFALVLVLLLPLPEQLRRKL